jgi:hypothetical protein
MHLSGLLPVLMVFISHFLVKIKGIQNCHNHTKTGDKALHLFPWNGDYLIANDLHGKGTVIAFLVASQPISRLGWPSGW